MLDFSKPQEVVIIGGSLAGLFSSITFSRLGHRVTLLERSPSPLLHDQGAGVVAGGETQLLYHRHDLFRREIAVTSKARLYLNKEGAIIDREGYEQRMTSWDLLYYLARANFDGTKSQYVDESDYAKLSGQDKIKQIWNNATYEYGREVSSVEEAGDKVKITWKDTRLLSVEHTGDAELTSEGCKEETIMADFIVCADGPSSHIRPLLLESPSKRTYAGYVAFRGTVPEVELSAAATEVFVEKFTFYHSDGVQILAYTIPGKNGSLESGNRLVNWVWYWNVSVSEPEYGEIMTDSSGNNHRFTLPTGGKMAHQVWERQKTRARAILPPQFAELVEKTMAPFVQAITDVQPPAKGTNVGRLLNGKAALVGDSLGAFRPHTAASTSQAAFDALMLEKAVAGEITWDDYEKRVLEFAWSWQKRGVMLGERSQFGRHPLSHSANEVSREELHMRKVAKS